MKLKTLLRYKYLILMILSIFISYIFTNISTNSKYLVNDTDISGYIHNYKIDGNKLSIHVVGLENIIGNYYFKDQISVDNFKSKYKMGDYINIKCKLIKPKDSGLFNQFSYKRYLKQNGVHFIMKIEEINKIKNNNKIRYKIKNLIIDRIEKVVLSKKYLYAFIIGEEYYINSNVKSSYQINGISHLFAVSGSNITFVIAILLKFIDKFKYKYFIIFGYVLLYMFLTDFTASIVRSGIFFILVTLNKIFKKNIDVKDLLYITLILSLIYNPYLIYSVGYQFSFIISLYLIIFQKLIKRFKSYIGMSFIVSLIAFLSSLPIVLNNFYEFNLLSVLLNIIYVPFVSFILFPLSLITFILPIFDKILYSLTLLLENSSLFFSNINIFKIIVGKPSTILMILYYMVITLILFKPKHFYLLIILIIINKVSNFTFKPSIEFIDVGQGDSILIRLIGNDILVDTGGVLKYETEFEKANEFDIGGDLLLPYFKSKGIDNIDYLFITHGDADHIGGAFELAKNMKIKTIFLNGNINHLEEKLLKYNHKILKKGDILNISNINFHVLNPMYDTNENDSSIVLYFNINGYNILLTGDASKSIEEAMIKEHDIDVDILKLGHHGSKTSTSETLISKTKPKYGIISVGENNRFKHPNKEVLDILNKYDVEIFRTDIDGSIRFVFDKKLKIKKGRMYEG